MPKRVRLDNPARSLPKPGLCCTRLVSSNVHVSVGSRRAQLDVARIHQPITRLALRRALEVLAAIVFVAKYPMAFLVRSPNSLAQYRFQRWHAATNNTDVHLKGPDMISVSK